MNQADQEKLEETLGNLESLPTLPVVATKLINMTSDLSINAQDIAKVVLTDQAITAKILKVVNSAYYSLPTRIGTISQAIMILGFETVKNLVLSVSVFDMFSDTHQDEIFDRECFWAHSLSVAVCSQLISERVHFKAPEQVFIMGLLHDIGLVVLDEILHDRFMEIITLSNEEEMPLIEAEMQLLGTDHAAIGKLVLTNWKMPRAFIRSIEHHHDDIAIFTNPKDDIRTFTAIIKLAEQISCLEGLGALYECRDNDRIDPKLLEIVQLSDSLLQDVIKTLPEALEQAAIVFKDDSSFLTRARNANPPKRTKQEDSEQMIASFQTTQKANKELGRINLALSHANKALNLKIMETGVLLDISNCMIRSFDTKQIINKMLDGVFSCLSIEDVIFYQKSGRILKPRGHLGFRFLDIQDVKDNNAVVPTILQLLSDQNPIYICTSSATDIQERMLLDIFSAKMLLIIPGVQHDTISALFVIANPSSETPYPQAILNSLQNFINHAVLAIERARMFETIRKFNINLRESNAQLGDKLRTIKQLQNYHDKIIENMPSGIITVNENGHIIAANSVAQELLSLKQSDICGQHYQTLTALGNLRIYLHKALEERQVCHRTAVEIVTPTGTKRTIGLSSALIKEDDNTIGAMVIFQDLTHIKQLQRELKIKDRLSSLGEMSAGIAHEIRNPLNPIMGFAQLLQIELKGDDQKQEYLTIIIEEVTRLKHLVSKFLDFARQRDLNLEDTYLKNLILHQVELLEPQLTETGTEVKLDLDNQMGPIGVDQEQICQILINLIQNAIAACGNQKHPRIEIKTYQDKNHEFQIIEIADNGNGVDTSDQDKLFNPFFTTKKDGTGLGLSVVHKIIDDHGGKIALDPHYVDGALFRVYLPLERTIDNTIENNL